MYNDGPTSSTLVQHCTNVIQMFCVYWKEIFHLITSFNLTDKPGEPGVPEITEIRKETCELSWQAPSSDGGAPITGYVVERRTGIHWIPMKEKATTTAYTVKGLKEGNKYEFRVVAENKAGQGVPSKSSAQITTKDPWSEY